MCQNVRVQCKIVALPWVLSDDEVLEEKASDNIIVSLASDVQPNKQFQCCGLIFETVVDASLDIHVVNTRQRISAVVGNGADSLTSVALGNRTMPCSLWSIISRK